MLNKVTTYIQRHSLLKKQSQYLVALSGGADSVCLLLLMKELGYQVHAVHCNFHLRGEESNRDEAFCRQLCEEQDVELHLTHFDTKTYAEIHKVSIEMAARELRYGYFEQLREALGVEDILVAHHSDDNVETLLLNLVRGTGIHGLEGIKPRNGHIVRPLLCISRQDILDYLTLRHQAYVTDSSNLIDDVQRNKVRLNLIPLLKTINPAAVQNILRTIDNVSEAVKIVDDAVEKGVGEVTSSLRLDTGDEITKVSVPLLVKLPSPEQILFTVLSKYGFTPSQIVQIYDNLNAPSGRTWASDSYVLATDREALLIASKKDIPEVLPEMTLPEAGIYIYNVRAKMKASVEERQTSFVPSKERYEVTLDADKVRFPLRMRGVRNGDVFVPFGMRGRKLVSDFLTDNKKNYFERKKQLMVEDADGKIIWLVGERTSQLCSVTAETIKILRLRYLNE